MAAVGTMTLGCSGVGGVCFFLAIVSKRLRGASSGSSIGSPGVETASGVGVAGWSGSTIGSSTGSTGLSGAAPKFVVGASIGLWRLSMICEWGAASTHSGPPKIGGW